MTLEIHGNAQFPEYGEGVEDLKALAFDETNPKTPVNVSLIARTVKEKENLFLLYEAIQDRILDCP